MYALLDQDEEVDVGVFPAYLRAQSDADLLDIQAHLDPERYPARVDAVRREAIRRRALTVAVHTPEECFIRGSALLVLLLAGAWVLLTILLTPADVTGPAWPTDEMLTNGTLVSTVMRLTLLGLLRFVVAGSVRYAIGPPALLLLAGWLLAHARRRSVRADVKQIALLACLALAAAFLLAAAPFSNVPGLFHPLMDGDGFWARLLTVLRP